MQMLKRNERNVLSSGAVLYPLIENLSVMNSNAYILSTGKAILIIDPGGTEERAAQLEKLIGEFLAEKERPVALLLTHCHWDHANALNSFTPEFRQKLTLICSEDTAEILAHPEEDVTAAKFFGDAMPTVTADLTLFAESSKDRSSAFSIRKNGFYNEIYADDEFVLSARYAPGHSPDGVFYFHHEAAFIGDLFFSQNPGVVGIPGWNADQFRKSAILLRNISEDQELIYCGGHSLPAFSTDSAVALQNLITNALMFEHVSTVNLATVKALEKYYFMLLREIDRLLDVFTNRLHYLGSVLEVMREHTVSSQFSEKDLFTSQERIVSQFRSEMEKKNQEGKIAPLMLAILGIRMIHKLKKNLQGNPLWQYVDPSLERRVEFLLTDFSNALSSLPFSEQQVSKNFKEEIQCFIESLKFKLDRTDIPVDSDEVFLSYIMKKIAMKNVLQQCTITLENTVEDFPAELCWDHFEEALRNLLEHLADLGERDIRLEPVQYGLIVKPSQGFTENLREQIRQGLSGEFLKRIHCRTAFTKDAMIILLPDHTGPETAL